MIYSKELRKKLKWIYKHYSEWIPELKLYGDGIRRNRERVYGRFTTEWEYLLSSNHRNYLHCRYKDFCYKRWCKAESLRQNARDYREYAACLLFLWQKRASLSYLKKVNLCKGYGKLQSARWDAEGL